MEADQKVENAPLMQPGATADDREPEQAPRAMDQEQTEDAGDKQSDLDVPGGKGIVRPDDVETTEQTPT